LPYGSSPDGKVFYVNALNSIKVTSYGDQSIDKIASVCGRYTVLFGKDAQIAKSIERRAPFGGTISNSNVALVNLGGSNYINGSTIPMNSGIPTLNQLKQNCVSIPI
jgi:hypothetical protein